MGSQLKSIGMQLQSQQMTQTMMTALGGATGVMTKINEDMDVSAIASVMKDFNKEMMKQEAKSEMVSDTFGMMEDPGQTAEAEDMYAGILGEIGLEYQMG